jgi:hypothetical protein
MRNLFYLSETKMRTFIPQLSRRFLRRLGIEGKVSVGYASLGVNWSGNTPPDSVIELLNAVVKKIEPDGGFRSRMDLDLIPGDWIRFDEQFHYGTGRPDTESDYQRPGLVYFAATAAPAFLMCGSAAHVLDRRQLPEDDSTKWVGAYYVEEVHAYARRVVEAQDEAANTVRPQTGGGSGQSRSLGHAISQIADEPRWETGWSEAVPFSGHARVLEVGENSPGQPLWVLATPLEVEYARRH